MLNETQNISHLQLSSVPHPVSHPVFQANSEQFKAFFLCLFIAVSSLSLFLVHLQALLYTILPIHSTFPLQNLSHFSKYLLSVYL